MNPEFVICVSMRGEILIISISKMGAAHMLWWAFYGPQYFVVGAFGQGILLYSFCYFYHPSMSFLFSCVQVISMVDDNDS